MTNKKLYLFFIILFSSVIANIVPIVSPGRYKSGAIVIVSTFILFLIHLKYFNFYNKLIESKVQEPSVGLIKSSMVGGMLNLVFASVVFIFTRSSGYNQDFENQLLKLSFILIVVTNLICVYILARIDSKKFSKKSFKILIASSGFYLGNFLICYLVYMFLLISVIGII